LDKDIIKYPKRAPSKRRKAI